jgi:hypothetical protein
MVKNNLKKVLVIVMSELYVKRHAVSFLDRNVNVIIRYVRFAARHAFWRKVKSRIRIMLAESCA